MTEREIYQRQDAQDKAEMKRLDGGPKNGQQVSPLCANVQIIIYTSTINIQMKTTWFFLLVFFLTFSLTEMH